MVSDSAITLNALNNIKQNLSLLSYKDSTLERAEVTP